MVHALVGAECVAPRWSNVDDDVNTTTVEAFSPLSSPLLATNALLRVLLVLFSILDGVDVDGCAPAACSSRSVASVRVSLRVCAQYSAITIVFFFCKVMSDSISVRARCCTTTMV